MDLRFGACPRGRAPIPLVMKKLRIAAATAAVSALAVVCSAVPAAALNVQIVNESGKSPDDIYLLLHNGSSTDGQLPAETPVKLSALPTSTFALGNITAGRLFVSYDQPVTAAEPPTYPVRNDKIEFTNPGKANLTSVDFFGIPMDIQTLDASGNVLESLAFKCHTSTIQPALLANQGGAAAQILTGAGAFSRILSPQLAPTAYPQMTAYLNFMAGKTIQLQSKFFGTPYQTTNYSGTFQPDGSITLTGTITTPSAGNTPVAGQPLVIQGSSLLEAIYTGNGDYTVGGNPAQVADNDVYAVIYRDVAAGFALGYWGGKYGNNSASWFGQPPFAAAWTSPPAFAPYFHQYAATIANFSDSYGFSFSDVGPAQVQASLDSSVATMRVTIDSDEGPSVPGCAGQVTPPTPPAVNPPTPAAPVVHPVDLQIRSRVLKLNDRGRALMAVRCTGDPCKGRVLVRARVKSGRKFRSVVIGSAVVRVGENRSARMYVRFNGFGKRLVKRSGRRGVVTNVTIALGPNAKPTVVERRRLKVVGSFKRR